MWILRHIFNGIKMNRATQECDRNWHNYGQAIKHRVESEFRVNLRIEQAQLPLQ